MSLSFLEQQRKQLEYLMKKSPNIHPVSELQDETVADNTESQIDEDASMLKDKSQKRSFDYSNYIRNKRLQVELIKTEQLKAKMNEEALEYKANKDRKERELETKTAKKRAVRQKKLDRLKQSRLNKQQPIDEE